MFQVFAGLGLGLMATKYVAEFRTNDPQKSGRIIVLSNLVAAGIGVVIALLFFIHRALARPKSFRCSAPEESP